MPGFRLNMDWLLVKLPEGAISIQRSWHLLEGIVLVFRYIPAFSLEGQQDR
jgi:hypothetical protein